MSTAPEAHLLAPPKPKLSPLELRNTDLVSRLLAATPPYLYNMSLLPNTYFFSEMLRSLVQAKNEQRGNMANAFGGNMFYGPQVRRSRKRAWSGANRESYNQNINSSMVEEKVEKPHVEKIDDSWMIKSMKKTGESPAELTAGASTSTGPHQKIEDHHSQRLPKSEDPPFAAPHSENSSNLVLPPPPPMWYPPIYPTPPYGIDPLHFFIDLRVSGHIYDRQNNNNGQHLKEAVSPVSDAGNSTVVSPKEPIVDKKEVKSEEMPEENMFIHPRRHCSAFSVPNPNGTKARNSNQTKFDVKSMGFDKGSNKTSTSYIMSNIACIYKNFAEKRDNSAAEASASDDPKCPVESSHETEAEKQKKVKDLRALIGLELVVDYMSHKKALLRSDESSSVISEEGDASSEIESCSSPPLEVVAVHDDV